MSIVVDMSHLFYRNVFANKAGIVDEPKLAAHLLLNSLYLVVNKFYAGQTNPLVAAFDCSKKHNCFTV